MLVLVQLADEHLELVDLLADLAEVAVVRLGGEEGDGVVAPGVRQLLARERVAERAVELVELEDRQQLDGGDSQLLQVGDLLDEPAVGAAQVALRRVVPGEAADVHLVDDRLLDRDVGEPVALPVEVAAVGDAPRGTVDVVDRCRCRRWRSGSSGFDVVVAERVGRPPVEVAGDGRGVGVEQGLGDVEPGPVDVRADRGRRPGSCRASGWAGPRRRCARCRRSGSSRARAGSPARGAGR